MPTDELKNPTIQKTGSGPLDNKSHFRKSTLKALLANFFPSAVLKERAKDLSSDFRAGTKTDAADIISENLKTTDTLDFVRDSFFSTHQIWHVYETSNGKNYRFGDLDKAVRKFDSSDVPDVLHLQASPSDRVISGLIKAKVTAQDYDESRDEITGTNRVVEFQRPFQIDFSRDRHLTFKFVKFNPNQRHAMAGGACLFIRGRLFDDAATCESLLRYLISIATNHRFEQSNLTTGLKTLIGEGRLRTTSVGAEDTASEGMNRRAQYATARTGPFIHLNWLKHHVLTSEYIEKSRWWWTDSGVSLGAVALSSFRAFTIDAQHGIISQDHYSAEKLDWIIDELISRND